MPAVPRTGEPPARGYVFAGPEVRRLTAEQFADAIGAITGEWNTYQPRAGISERRTASAPTAGPPPSMAADVGRLRPRVARRRRAA